MMRRRSLWTEKEVAAYLAVSVRTVQGWRRSGEGPPWFMLGRLRRYRPESVDAWLAQQQGVVLRREGQRKSKSPAPSARPRPVSSYP